MSLEVLSRLGEIEQPRRVDARVAGIPERRRLPIELRLGPALPGSSGTLATAEGHGSGRQFEMGRVPDAGGSDWTVSASPPH